MSSPRAPGRSDLRQRLAGASVLACLGDAVLDTLAERTHLVRFPKGATVCTRGDDGDSLMIVESGHLKVFNLHADGKEIVLNFLGPGDLIGELAVLDARPRAASVVTLEPTELLTLYRRDLLPILTGNPDAMMEVVRVLCDKLRNASSVIEDNVLPMTARTAAGLLRLAEQHGRRAKDGIRIELALSQRDLGGYLELSRENANRQLALLRDAGVVRLDGANLVILDEEALRRYASAEG